MIDYVVRVCEPWQYSQWSGTTILFEYNCKAETSQGAVDEAIKFAKEEKNISCPVVTSVFVNKAERFIESLRR